MDPELLAALLRQGATPDQVQVFLRQHAPQAASPSIGAVRPVPAQSPTSKKEAFAQGISAALSGVTFGSARRIPAIRRNIEDAKRAGRPTSTPELLGSTLSAALLGMTRLPLAVQGAIIGGAGGIGHTAGASPRGQAVGTALGTGVGAALPPVMRGAGRLVGGVARAVLPASEGHLGRQAAKVAAKELLAAGIPPGGMLQGMQEIATTPLARAQVRPLGFMKEVGEKVSAAAMRSKRTTPRLFEKALDDVNTALQKASGNIEAAVRAAPPANAETQGVLRNLSDEGKRLWGSVARDFPAAGRTKEIVRARAQMEALHANETSIVQTLERRFGPGAGQVTDDATLEALDSFRKQLGARMGELKPGSGHQLRRLQTDRQHLDAALASQYPEYATANKEWAELTNLAARTKQATHATELSFAKKTRLGDLPEHRFAGAARREDPQIHFLQARGITQAGIGRVASGAANFAADLLRVVSGDISDAQAAAIVQRALRPGPEGVQFVRQIITAAENQGRTLLPFEKAQMWSLVIPSSGVIAGRTR